MGGAGVSQIHFALTPCDALLMDDAAAGGCV
jgi:hypothetical protein